MRKLAQTIQLNVTPAIAAKLLKDMCGKSGKDVIEHLLDIMGTNDQQMLDYTFNSMDSSYHHNGQYQEGEGLFMKTDKGVEDYVIDHILRQHNIKSIAIRKRATKKLEFFSPRELDAMIEGKVLFTSRPTLNGKETKHLLS